MSESIEQKSTGKLMLTEGQSKELAEAEVIAKYFPGKYKDLPNQLVEWYANFSKKLAILLEEKPNILEEDEEYIELLNTKPKVASEPSLPLDFQLISSAISKLKEENLTLNNRIIEGIERNNRIEVAFKKLVSEVESLDENLSVNERGEIKEQWFDELNAENDELTKRIEALTEANARLETECETLKKANSELHLLVKQAPAMNSLIEEIKSKLEI